MGISKEAEVSIAASSMFPGFRFSPTDEELIMFYLKNKINGFDQSVELINEVDICKHEPWDLPAKSIIKSDHEWFFFSPRGKKYPNGSQSKRATEIGYWKATGKERGLKSGSEIIGTKRTLVFHIGRAPKGERTEWIMHEYCLAGNPQDSLVVCRVRRKIDANGNISPSLEVGNSNPLLTDGEGASSGLGWDPNRMSTEKAVQCCSKKCSSSHGSHSVEQNDHASESGMKLNDEGMEPESSSQPKLKLANGNKEDDCFADILKDNIIELDEATLPIRNTGQVLVQAGTSAPRIEAANGPPGHAFKSHINISQGTAKRRIRLKKLRDEMHNSRAENSNDTGSSSSSSNKKRSGSKLSMRYRKKTSRLYVVMIIGGLLVMVFIFLGSPFQGSFCLCPPPAVAAAMS